MNIPNPRISLRTYVYIDSLQPQLAEYMATVSQGFPPVPGDAMLWMEVEPGMAVHRYTDIALKASSVHLTQQIVERAYGSMVIHHKTCLLYTSPSPRDLVGNRVCRRVREK